MIITQLGVNGLRNLSSLDLAPCSSINQLVGTNGAGKSSLLESIYLLANGHTFRTRKTKDLLPPGIDLLSVTAKLMDEATNRTHQCGLSKSRAGETQLKLDFQTLNSMAELTRMLPVKALYPESHRLIQESPDYRRQFLDWGLFHVKPDFFVTWKSYRRCLQQRNQALKLHRSNAEIAAWDDELAQAGELLHGFRQAYVEELAPGTTKFLENFGLKDSVSLGYRRGWLKDLSLLEALEAEQTQSVRSTFTTVGPHRAELTLQVGQQQARHVLSRGEQKCLVYALHLSQLELLSKSIQTRPIVLCDDLAAELDTGHSGMVLEALIGLNVQTFISGTQILDLSMGQEQKVFTIEGGVTTQVI